MGRRERSDAHRRHVRPQLLRGANWVHPADEPHSPVSNCLFFPWFWQRRAQLSLGMGGLNSPRDVDVVEVNMIGSFFVDLEGSKTASRSNLWTFGWSLSSSNAHRSCYIHTHVECHQHHAQSCILGVWKHGPGVTQTSHKDKPHRTNGFLRNSAV